MKNFLIIMIITVLFFAFGTAALAAASTEDNTASNYTATPQAATASQQELHEPSGSVTTATPTLPAGTVNDDTVKLVLVVAASAFVAIMLIFYKRHKNDDQ